MLPPRPRLSNRDRMRLFDLHGRTCHLCGEAIDGVRQKWEVEHVLSRGMIGAAADTDDNMRPTHVACHKVKTVEDAGRLAKAERCSTKHFGGHRSRHVMPGSRASGFKRLVGSGTVRRDIEVWP